MFYKIIQDISFGCHPYENSLELAPFFSRLSFPFYLWLIWIGLVKIGKRPLLCFVGLIVEEQRDFIKSIGVRILDTKFKVIWTYSEEIISSWSFLKTLDDVSEYMNYLLWSYDTFYMELLMMRKDL